MKELRTLGDEAARILQACAQEGLAPPVDQRQDFETFMRLVSSNMSCENVVSRRHQIAHITSVSIS